MGKKTTIGPRFNLEESALLRLVRSHLGLQAMSLEAVVRKLALQKAEEVKAELQRVGELARGQKAWRDEPEESTEQGKEPDND